MGTAIVTDVEQEEVEQEVKKPTLARDEMLQAMAERRREDVKKESTEKLPSEDVVEEVEQVETETEDELVDLKVDGQVIRKPKSEVDAEGGVPAMQKKIALETRLAQAAEERKAIERERADLARQRAEIQRLMQQPKKSDVPPVDIGAIAKKFVDSVYSGDEAESLNAFNEVVSAITPQEQRQQQQIDPNAIAERVEKRIQYKTSLNTGVQQFQKDYPHIVADPRLYKMTDDITDRMVRENPSWSPDKVILEAAKEVDEWVSQFRSAEKNILEERNERKRSIDNIPTAQGKKASAPGFKPKSPREIFEDVSRGRSQ